MEKNRSHITDRILDLTLEIIYLLTGEECIIAKKTSGDQVMPNSLLGGSQSCSRKQSTKVGPTTYSLSELNNGKKILEVTQKIIELLTGEVPIRCQDVTVYFSMEEWEYLEGHKELYKDIMMENRPTLTSPDGSSNRNPPERCPRPLYSRDSTQEHQKIPQNNQGGCARNWKVSPIKVDKCVNTLVKQASTDGSISKNAQQRFPNPFKSTQEHHKISYDKQHEPRLSVEAEDIEKVEGKFMRMDIQQEHKCWLNNKAEVNKKEENKILRTDVQKEKHEHPLTFKTEDTERVESKFLRMDVQRECQSNIKADVKEKDANTFLRTNLQKERHEHPLNMKADDPERVKAKFLRLDVQKERECQSNVKAEVQEKDANTFLRTNLQKERSDHHLNMKADDPERVEAKVFRLDVQNEHECQSNVKAKVKEREDNQILRFDLHTENQEHQLNITERVNNTFLSIGVQTESPLNVKAELTETVEDRFVRTEMQRSEHQFNFKADVTERPESKSLRTDVQKKDWELPVPKSSIRNTPKKYPIPLYNWESTEEHQKVLRDEKGKHLLNIKVEEMESDDETYLWRDSMCNEDYSTDGSNNRNTPEKCRSPPYSWKSTLENHKILSNYQEERPSQRQAGGGEAPEKMYGKDSEQSREKGIPPEIGTDGRYMGHNMEKCPMIFPDGEMEDDVTGDSLEENPIGANFYTIPHSMGQSSGPSTHAGSFLSHLPPVTTRTYRRRGETFMCSECGECFTAKAKLFKHQRDHIVDKPHSCPDCGKCFVEKSHLVNHQRSHSVEKPYSCSICGKCFGEKGHLANHEKSHANEKEFFCYECGKCFTQRGHFNRHQRLHTGEKPYPCPECGKCFPHREYLIRHQRVHAGQKPFPCSECGKCFTDKYDLAKHERIHSGHRPYSCPECGRGFTQKSNLARHVRVHADYNRIHVLTVGNGSPGEPPSSTISVPTKDARFLYQDMTAE